LLLFPKLLQTPLRKEDKMDEQIELFQISQSNWVSRLWASMPAPARQEVVELLAQMGQAALQTQRVKPATPNKEGAHES
jgi:hypothetical protein